MALTNKPNAPKRHARQGETRAAVVSVIVAFGFFQYNSLTGLYKTSHGLFVFVCVELAIGCLGAAWTYWEIRRDRRRK